MNKPLSLSPGDRIITLPSSTSSDMYFSRSFLLLVEHNEEGSLGFIMNKSLGITLAEIIPDTDASFTVFSGGPVAQGQLYYVHNRADLISGSTHIQGNVYWGGNFEEILYLINQGKLNSNDIKFFQGYSGWGKGQLLAEFEEEFWIKVSVPLVRDIFKLNYKEYWKRSIISLGKKYCIWINAPENPTLN